MNYNIYLAVNFLFWGSAFMLLSFLFMLKRSKMLRDGIRSTATITEVKAGKAERGRNGKIIYKHTYTLQYAAGNNDITTTKSFRTASREFDVGDTIEIVYLPEKPESVFAYNLKHSFLNKTAAAAGVAFGGSVIFIAGVAMFFIKNNLYG